MSKMYNPPHPGSILREDVMPALGITVTDAAKELGVSRAALPSVVNEKTAISPEMALRLEAWFDRHGYKGAGLSSEFACRWTMICRKPGRSGKPHNSQEPGAFLHPY